MLRKIISGLLLTVLVIAGCSSDKKTEMDMRVVAKAGDIDFTMYDLECYMIRMNFKNPEDEFKKKTGFLETHMDKYIAADAGIKQGYLDSIVIDTTQAHRILYEIIYKENVTDYLDFSESGFQKFLSKYIGMLYLKQIVLDDEVLADSLYQILSENSDDFETYVKEFSIEDETRENGGDLGYRRVTEVPLDLRDAVFKMEVNSVSKPLKSPFGIHILKLYDKIIETGEEMEKNRDAYYLSYLFHQREILQKDFYYKAIKEVPYEVFWDSIQVIVDKALKLREERFGLDQPLSFCIAPSYLTDEEKEIVVVKVGNFNYTASQFLQELKNSHIREGINFDKKPLTQNALISLMLPRLMHHYGELKGKRNTSEFERQMYHTKIGYVYQEFTKQHLLDTITVAQEELQAAYERAIHNFLVLEEIKVSEIQLDTRMEAEQVMNELKVGVPFERLVKKTVRDGFAEINGDLGACSAKRYPPIYEAVMNKKVGEYAGPIEFEGKWSVVRVNEKIPEHYQPLHEVESSVRGLVLGGKKFNVYNDWISAKKEEIEFFIDEDLIKANLITGKYEDAS